MSILVEPVVQPADYFPFLTRLPGYGSETKRDNLARLLIAREAGELAVQAAPAYIRFEPSAHCNLRCCWAQRRPRHPALRPRGHATVELARRVVDQIGQTLYQVILCHWGEPTLNPDLPELVRVFHDACVYTTFDTNMTLMTADLAARLVDSGLDAVSASIDGISQHIYEQYRIGGDVTKAVGGLSHLIEQRRRLGRSNPKVRWQFLVFPHNEHEVDQAERLAAEIGVDQFEAFAAGGRRWTRRDGFLPGPPVAAGKRAPGLLCNDPWMYLAVDWDGAIHLCCRAFQAKHVVGHLDEQPLPDIFDNERFQLARRVIRDGTWSPPDGPIPCTGCRKITQFVPAIAKLGHSLGLDDPWPGGMPIGSVGGGQPQS